MSTTTEIHSCIVLESGEGGGKNTFPEPFLLIIATSVCNIASEQDYAQPSANFDAVALSLSVN